MNAGLGVAVRGARWFALAACLGVLVAGCGGKDPEPVAASPPAGTGTTPEAPGTGAPVAAGAPEKRMATAVTDGKPSAPIDLQYELPAKPERGVPFDIVLAFSSRVRADTLDIEVAESPGLVVEGESMARFVDVRPGEPQEFTLKVRGDRDGIHYVALVARLSSQVQSEGRGFSVPVVIGTPGTVQKPEPARDASGQPVEPMRARED